MKLRSGANPDPKDVFLFLQLPGEIRNMIYQLLFHPDVDHLAIIMCYQPKQRKGVLKTKAQRKAWHQTKVEPLFWSSIPRAAILRTCKQLFQETKGFAPLAWSRTCLDLTLLNLPGPALSRALNGFAAAIVSQLQYVLINARLLLLIVPGQEKKASMNELHQTLMRTRMKRLTLLASSLDTNSSSAYIENWIYFTDELPRVESHSLQFSFTLHAAAQLLQQAQRSETTAQSRGGGKVREITLNGYTSSEFVIHGISGRTYSR